MDTIAASNRSFDFAGADGDCGVTVGVERSGLVLMSACGAEAEGKRIGSNDDRLTRSVRCSRKTYDDSRYERRR